MKNYQNNIKTVGNILGMFNELLILLEPALKETIYLKKQEKLQNEANFIKTAKVSDNTSEECKSFEFQGSSEEFSNPSLDYSIILTHNENLKR
ncbi:MAG: hypothetical protein ACXAAH_00975 [Promethearchaeota archaeon]|jgi:hypothetical protein